MGRRRRHRLTEPCFLSATPDSSATKTRCPPLPALPSVFPIPHARTQADSGPPSDPLPPDITEVFLALSKPFIDRKAESSLLQLEHLTSRAPALKGAA